MEQGSIRFPHRPTALPLPGAIRMEGLGASHGRLPLLDGLRGLAVLLVLAHHTHVPFPIPGGYLGVDLFFVLSGFLITFLLVREWQDNGSISLPRFYMRRTLRLVPALWTVLLIFALVTLVVGSRHELALLRRDAPSILLYFFNWRHGLSAKPVALPHLWSLSVEEQFYLLWPPVLAGLLACRLRRRWILALVLAAVAAPAFLRAALVPLPIVPEKFMALRRVGIGTDTRADTLFAGCLVGLLAGWGMVPKNAWVLGALRRAAWPAAVVAALHLLLCSTDPGTRMHTYLFLRGGLTVVAVSLAIVLAAVLWSPPPLMSRFLETPALGWVGRVSYAVYLWNIPILIWLAKISWPPVSRNLNLIAWTGSVAAGALSYYYVEMPFLRLKQRWASRTPASEAPPAKVAA
jgi:peptidoglycan/LPS O-acetylase OafA/YrhL